MSTRLVASAMSPLLRRGGPNSIHSLSVRMGCIVPCNRSIHSSIQRRSDAIFVHRDTPDNNPQIPFSFNPENMKRVEQIISKYPPQYKKAAVIPLLDLGQRQLGWTSISVMNEVARILEMPSMRVYEVATFYTMFNREPVGKYFLQVCTTTPCALCGAKNIVHTLEEELGITPGHTTADGLFTLVEVECLGACVNAPMIAVNDEFYEDLTPETTKELLKDLKSGERKIKPGPMSGRKSCEPKTGQTTLKDEPYGPGAFMRTQVTACVNSLTLP